MINRIYLINVFLLVIINFVVLILSIVLNCVINYLVNFYLINLFFDILWYCIDLIIKYNWFFDCLVFKIEVKE